MSWCCIAPDASLEDLMVNNVVSDAFWFIFFGLSARDEHPQPIGVCHSGARDVELSMGEEWARQVDSHLYRYFAVKGFLLFNK